MKLVLSTMVLVPPALSRRGAWALARPQLASRSEVVDYLTGPECRRIECGTKRSGQVRKWSFRRAALGISAAAMLAGCGGSQPPISATAQDNLNLPLRCKERDLSAR
jgi:hypothetical protein